MNFLSKFIICAACITILATAPIASAQGKLEGVWKSTEVTFTGPNARTITNLQPGFLIFTKKHFCQIGIQGSKPQPDLPQTDATDAQKVATWTPFNGMAGTYEADGTTLTGHLIVGKNPVKPGSFLTADFKIEGNTLSVMLKTTQDGPIANPMTMKFVRVE
jgi:hypothetical protein